MRLHTADPELEELCRTVEAKLSAYNECDEIDLTVSCRDTFEDLEGATVRALRETYAVYRADVGDVLINRAEFFKQDMDLQEYILAHEIGEVVCKQVGPPVEEEPPPFRLSCDTWADWYTCKWGYLESALRLRATGYGSEYCEYLKLWESVSDFRERMLPWYHRKVSGQLNE